MVRIPALRLTVPAAVALVLVPLIAYCARTYPWHALYFDHSMYQYTGWAIRHGDRLYADVAVPDGPFITWLHAIIQMTAGESERAFRWADLFIHVSGTLAIGAVLAPYRARVAWAFAISSLWLAQYFRYDWHWTAQREAYYALAGYAGMALLLLATRRYGRRMIVLSLVGGALVGTQLFGKHIGLIFVALGLVPALLSSRERRWLLVRWAVAGSAGGIGLCLLALAITGDLGEFVFWYFEVPGPYRWIMGSADFWHLLGAIDRHTTVLAGAALVAGVAAIRGGVLPRRYLGFIAAPALFLIAMVLQRKGHVYQAHPVTAGTYVVFALIAMHLVRRVGTARILGAVLVVLLVVDAARGLATSWWISPTKVTRTSQLGAPHVNHADMRAAARKLAEVTRPGDRVFAFGPAGRLLYEAKRHSAVPPFTNFFFNVEQASVVGLSAQQRKRLDDLQDEIARRACPRLREPPAALVICDGADWSSGDGLADAQQICPELAYAATPSFTQVGVYGCWRILVRGDRPVTP